MKLILHEVELKSNDVEAGRKFYHDLLGLPVHVDQDGLKVFDSGRPGLDLDVSVHNPGKTAITFLVNDLDQFIDEFRKKGGECGNMYDTHQGMRAVALEDPDGNSIEIQSPTEKSPPYLHDLIK